MLTPQFVLPLARELVIDLFAGGGGASTGLERALGRHVDIAVNHDREAVALHLANHPQTKHYVSDVFEVDPLEVTEGQPVGLLWASPDCKHFSKAKGGKPVSKRIRGLAWVVVKWAKLVRPRVIFLENVEEFQTWGPLDENNMPCPKRKGRTFKRWKSSLENLGYRVEWKELRGCDYGAPTIRKRLFLVARCDGRPIVWPEPTHAAPAEAKAKKLKPWRTAADCIDWSLPCPSIFERARPLAEATMRRIAKGVMRYVVDAKQPFIVTNMTGHPGAPVSKPVRTITTAGNQALVDATIAPFITEHANASKQRVFTADEPLRTQVAQVKGGHFALVSAFLAQHNNHQGAVPNVGRPADVPLSTITSRGTQQQVVTANLVHMGHGEGKDGGKRFSHGIRDVALPLNTVTATGAPAGLVTSHMVKLRGTSRDGQPVDQPLHTISAQGQHFGEVRAFLIKYYGTDQDPRLTEPMHTIPTKDRFGLVMVKGEPYAIVDIGMRMLVPRELYRANGFPEDYIFDWGIDPYTGAVIELTKTAQVRMCGNAVNPQMAEALTHANYSEQVVVEERAYA